MLSAAAGGSGSARDAREMLNAAAGGSGSARGARVRTRADPRNWTTRHSDRRSGRNSTKSAGRSRQRHSRGTPYEVVGVPRPCHCPPRQLHAESPPQTRCSNAPPITRFRVGSPIFFSFLPCGQNLASVLRCERAPPVAGEARRAPAPDRSVPDLPRGPRAVTGRRRPHVSPVTPARSTTNSSSWRAQGARGA